MGGNLTKREFLRLSSMGGVAAAIGLLTGTQAEADPLPPEHDLPPPEEKIAELAQSLAAISYIAALAFVSGRATAQDSSATVADRPAADSPPPYWITLSGRAAAAMADLMASSRRLTVGSTSYRGNDRNEQTKRDVGFGSVADVARYGYIQPQ